MLKGGMCYLNTNPFKSKTNDIIVCVTLRKKKLRNIAYTLTMDEVLSELLRILGDSTHSSDESGTEVHFG